ncbi:MAG: serine hydrolase, partial [Wenzhouxiangellaceae bacterium]
MSRFSRNKSRATRRGAPVLTILTLLLMGSALHAQPLLNGELTFRASFEGDPIEPRFPLVGGEFELPDLPVTRQLAWLLDELQTGATTTLAEVQQRFVSGFDPQQMVNFIATLRSEFPNARILDVIGITPMAATVVIDGDSGPPAFGFVNLQTQYSGNELVTFFQVSNFFGSVQFPTDSTLNLEQAADRFMTLGSENGLFVGYIDAAGECIGVIERNPDTPRALGSIFKTWVLGGVAEAVSDGSVMRADTLALDAAERAAGGTLNNEPLGTLVSVQDMATLMMGISDNTATDHLHELVGRVAVGDFMQGSGVADPNLLLPFLNISEQFHVFTRFDLATALSYVNGSEAFQQAFLNSDIEPLGPSFPINFPFFHDSLLTSGTWRATPRDICRTLGALREMPEDQGALALVDEAMGAQAAQPGIRNRWARVWYKG